MLFLTQNFNWKSDWTRNEKERWGVSSGGVVEGGTKGVKKGSGVLMTADMAMVKEPLYPIAILINELNNDDIQLQLNSICHLYIIT